MNKDLNYFLRVFKKNSLIQIMKKTYYFYFFPKNIVFLKKLKTGLIMALPSKDKGLSKDIFVNGIREEKALTFFLNMLGSDDTIIDCGANMGFYVMHEAKKSKFVHAIEPVETSLCFTGINCFLNNIENFKLYNLAIGEKNSQITFFKSKYFNLSSVEKRFDKNIDLGYSEIKIDMQTIDFFMEKNNISANVLRMDTEGMEVNILKGATKFLKQKNACVFLEVHKVFIGSKGVKDLCDLLLNNGFVDAYFCDDEKIYDDAYFQKVGLLRLKETADLQKEVFHIFCKKDGC